MPYNVGIVVVIFVIPRIVLDYHIVQFFACKHHILNEHVVLENSLSFLQYAENALCIYSSL